MRLRLGMLASHGGTNVQSVVQACGESRLAAEPALIISNNRDSAFTFQRPPKTPRTMLLRPLLEFTQIDCAPGRSDSGPGCGNDLLKADSHWNLAIIPGAMPALRPPHSVPQEHCSFTHFGNYRGRQMQN